jgi:hypothetical protein
MLIFEELREEFSDQVWLQISANDWQTASLSVQNASNQFAKYNAGLNRLVANKLMPWFQEEYDVEAKLWPSAEELPTIWEFVNGTALMLDNTRVAIVPSENIDIEELRVPQEWIDIPDWVANYYIAVQVNREDNWLRVWGYATHEQLKTNGDYDPFTQTYALERADVIEDLEVMWVARSLCPNETVKVHPLPSLLSHQVKSLLSQLSQPFPYSPRLEVEFSQWAALLSDSSTRKQLYELRSPHSKVAEVATSITAAFEKSLKKLLVRLSDLKEKVVTGEWQTIDQFIASVNQAELAWQFRQSDRDVISPSLRPETIHDLIDQIYHSTNEHQRKQAAERLADVRDQKEEVIEALVYLIRDTDNEETRWTAAESLWAIDPGNPVADIRMIKDLGMLLLNYPVALMAAMLEKANQKIAVLLRVYPLRNQRYLPSGLQLNVLDEKGNQVPQLEAEAREQDDYIQLKFTGDRLEQFSVRVALGEAEIIEYFVI